MRYFGQRRNNNMFGKKKEVKTKLDRVAVSIRTNKGEESIDYYESFKSLEEAIQYLQEKQLAE